MWIGKIKSKTKGQHISYGKETLSFNDLISPYLINESPIQIPIVLSFNKTTDIFNGLVNYTQIIRPSATGGGQ